MLRVTLLLLCLLAPFAQAHEHAHDLAYSLGVKLGERLRDEVPDLELQALLDGLRRTLLRGATAVLLALLAACGATGA